jgi:hypothetical protein
MRGSQTPSECQQLPLLPCATLRSGDGGGGLRESFRDSFATASSTSAEGAASLTLAHFAEVGTSSSHGSPRL